jgi:hypothetical protein
MRKIFKVTKSPEFMINRKGYNPATSNYKPSQLFDGSS